jgi:putative ABC transport system ATP-binding protein
MYSAGKHSTGAGAAIAVAGLARRFGADASAISALDDVSFTFDAGAMVALMGPSGSGKSTLLHLLGALDRSDSGSVRVDGLELAAASRRELIGHRRRTGFVFQRFNLLPTLTATDNVLAPVLPLRVDFDKAKRASELLAEVGLEGRGASLPSELSGGEQQRVAIARALINAPSLLLADEPTGNLDSATGAEVLRLIMRLRAEHGMTVVIATHDAGVAAQAERVIQLRDGRITDDTTVAPHSAPAELMARINELRQ